MSRRVVLLSAADRMAEAVDAGLAALTELGVHLPRRASRLRRLIDLTRATRATRADRAPAWRALPPITDPESITILRLMASLNGAVYALDKRLLVHLLSRNVTELAARGRTPWAGIILGNFAIILLGRGRIEHALALTDLAEELGATLPPGPATRLTYITAMFVRPWARPFAESLPPMRAAARQAYEAGDIEYGLLLTTGMHMLSFFGAGHLGQLEADLAHSRAALGPYATGARLMMQTQMQRCVGHLTGQIPLDAQDLARGHVPGDRANVIERRMVIAIPVLCVFGEYDLAVEAAERVAGPPDQRFFGIAFGVVFRFYRAFATLCAGHPPAHARSARRALRPHARRNPQNFGAFPLALDAELHRAAGRTTQALVTYGHAADHARAHGDRLLHGLLEERWAALYDQLGFAAEARLHRAHARQVYAAWGAAAKVDALTAAHPRLQDHITAAERPEFSSLASTSSLQDVGRRLDMATVWNVARDLSGDLRLDAVVTVVLDAALHNAGATAGLLALAEDDGTLRAVGRRHVEGPQEPLDRPLADLPDAPHHLMRYVARTREPLVLDRADQGRFDDPSLQARPATAILCVPLTTRERDVGVLYLENDRVVGAFTRDRAHILQLIGLQAAVSLQNARLHQATERLAQTLEQRVADRTAELAIARDAALEATRAKSAFLAAMSHEIRTPMNGLLGTAQLLAETRLDPRQRDYVDIIEGSADSLLTVLNDILDFSKIEAGRFIIERRPFSLRETVDASAQLVAELAGRKSLDLVVDLDASVPDRVQGDGTRLRQILLNLVGNAIKFTETGRVELRVRPHGDHIRFEVEDTGIGIAPDQIDHLFQPFAQADGSISRRFGGTGLGLAICKRLVELMGGRIGVDSAPRRGSTFWFDLPLPQDTTAAPAPRAPEGTTPPTDRPEATARVLVVEDNLVNQKITRWMLERHGYACVVVGDGIRALEAEAHQPFDAILMDCQMPEMDGLEATRRLRARGCTLPIIALTAGALEDERAACRAAGMNDFVPKPIKMPELLAALATHLGDHTAPAPAAASGQGRTA
ncbi:MAG: ATP-binding protein [bacterium]